MADPRGRDQHDLAVDPTAPKLAAVGRCGDTAPALFENMPPINCALPAGHPGWHRADDGAEWTPSPTPAKVCHCGNFYLPCPAHPDLPGGLTVDQQIRARALGCATCYDPVGSRPTEAAIDQVLTVAQMFAAWIATGDGVDP